jgi:hypothetical protein
MRIHIKHYDYDWAKPALYYCWRPEWDRRFRFAMPLLSYQGAWELAFDTLKRRGAEVSYEDWYEAASGW